MTDTSVDCEADPAHDGETYADVVSDFVAWVWSTLVLWSGLDFVNASAPVGMDVVLVACNASKIWV